MRISLDAGALCAAPDARYGTYVFTRNMIEAFGRYDQQNAYIAYTFCDVLELEHKNVSVKKLPQKLWMSYHVTAHEIMEPNDVFLGLSQALPLASKARIFTFSHGLSFLFYKELYKENYDRLKKQLEMSLRASDYLFVTSQKVKDELRIRYEFENAVVIQPGVPFDMVGESKTLVEYQLPKPNYFLFVAMNHPIKRVDLIVKHFKAFKRRAKFKDFGLYLVGNFTELQDSSENIYVFENITREYMRYLYKNACAYLTASLYESFHFPILEALSQGCPVIGYSSAVIPEMRPFVMTAHDEKEFMYWMEQLSFRVPQLPNMKEINARFSWEKTVEIVRRHYVPNTDTIL